VCVCVCVWTTPLFYITNIFTATFLLWWNPSKFWRQHQQ